MAQTRVMTDVQPQMGEHSRNRLERHIPNNKRRLRADRQESPDNFAIGWALEQERTVPLSLKVL
jgi:hypothetical protein